MPRIVVAETLHRVALADASQNEQEIDAALASAAAAMDASAEVARAICEMICADVTLLGLPAEGVRLGTESAHGDGEKGDARPQPASDSRLRLLRVLVYASEKTATCALAEAVRQCGPAAVFELLEVDTLALTEAQRLSLRAGTLLQVLSDPRGLARLPTSTASSVVALLVKEYIATVAWPNSSEQPPSLPRLPVGLAHRYAWLDNLPPLTFGHCPGPGASASALSQLRQLQALVCRYMTPGTAEALRAAVEDSCNGEDYPGRAALRLVCWPLCQRFSQAMAFILCGNPALAAEYVTHCVRVGWLAAEQAWPDALALATPFCQVLGKMPQAEGGGAGARAVAELASREDVPQPLRDVLKSGGAVSVPSRSEFLSAYKAMLREAALTLSRLGVGVAVGEKGGGWGGKHVVGKERSAASEKGAAVCVLRRPPTVSSVIFRRRRQALSSLWRAFPWTAICSSTCPCWTTVHVARRRAC